jgi:hypothetical protein
MQPNHNVIRILGDSLMRLAGAEQLRREADILSELYLANTEDWPETLRDFKTALLTAIKELEERQG